MNDDSDNEPTAYWIEDHRVTDSYPETARVEAIADTDSETVTFARRQPGDGGTTTAWITADAALVVEGSEMR